MVIPPPEIRANTFCKSPAVLCGKQKSAGTWLQNRLGLALFAAPEKFGLRQADFLLAGA
jgi:hypothetical protein